MGVRGRWAHLIANAICEFGSRQTYVGEIHRPRAILPTPQQARIFSIVVTRGASLVLARATRGIAGLTARPGIIGPTQSAGASIMCASA